MYARSKSDGTKSSITKCVILVIQIHSWIRSKHQRSVSQKKKHMTSKYQKVWAWLNDLKEAPLGDHDKITNRSSSRCVSHKWRWSYNSMKIYKSQPKGKYSPVWHQMYGRLKNRTTSDHPSSNAWSQSSISTTESGPNIIEASPRRRSMMISKYKPNLKCLSK